METRNLEEGNKGRNGAYEALWGRKFPWSSRVRLLTSSNKGCW